MTEGSPLTVCLGLLEAGLASSFHMAATMQVETGILVIVVEVTNVLDFATTIAWEPSSLIEVWTVLRDCRFSWGIRQGANITEFPKDVVTPTVAVAAAIWKSVDLRIFLEFVEEFVFECRSAIDQLLECLASGSESDEGWKIVGVLDKVIAGLNDRGQAGGGRLMGGIHEGLDIRNERYD